MHRPEVIEAGQHLMILAIRAAVPIGSGRYERVPFMPAFAFPPRLFIGEGRYLIRCQRKILVRPFRCNFRKPRSQVIETRKDLIPGAIRTTGVILSGSAVGACLPFVAAFSFPPEKLMSTVTDIVWCYWKIAHRPFIREVRTLLLQTVLHAFTNLSMKLAIV